MCPILLENILEMFIEINHSLQSAPWMFTYTAIICSNISLLLSSEPNPDFQYCGYVKLHEFTDVCGRVRHLTASFRCNCILYNHYGLLI